jgi:hypothetical protein
VTRRTDSCRLAARMCSAIRSASPDTECLEHGDAQFGVGMQGHAQTAGLALDQWSKLGPDVINRFVKPDRIHCDQVKFGLHHYYPHRGTLMAPSMAGCRLSRHRPAALSPRCPAGALTVNPHDRVANQASRGRPPYRGGDGGSPASRSRITGSSCPDARPSTARGRHEEPRVPASGR